MVVMVMFALPKPTKMPNMVYFRSPFPPFLPPSGVNITLLWCLSVISNIAVVTITPTIEEASLFHFMGSSPSWLSYVLGKKKKKKKKKLEKIGKMKTN